MIVASKEVRSGKYQTVTVLDTETGLVYSMKPEEKNLILTIKSLHAPKETHHQYINGEAADVWCHLFWDHNTDQVRDLIRDT